MAKHTDEKILFIFIQLSFFELKKLFLFHMERIFVYFKDSSLFIHLFSWILEDKIFIIYDFSI